MRNSKSMYHISAQHRDSMDDDEHDAIDQDYDDIEMDQVSRLSILQLEHSNLDRPSSAPLHYIRKYQDEKDPKGAQTAR